MKTLIPSINLTCFTLLFFAISETTRFVTVSADSTSIYDTLKSHGLPMGLLPKGVTNYTIDEEGNFEVYLDQACNAKFESELHYEICVSGQLGVGRIGNLSGISAQELFLWFPVKGIRVDIPSSGVIYFDVGVVFKQLSLSLFESPPDCLAPKEKNFSQSTSNLIWDNISLDTTYEIKIWIEGYPKAFRVVWNDNFLHFTREFIPPIGCKAFSLEKKFPSTNGCH